MKTFAEAMESNPPRLVVKFSWGPDNDEQFEWGITATMPMMSLIGELCDVLTADLQGGTDVAECDQSALVIIYDIEAREFNTYIDPCIPTAPLKGMLEVIKHLLVADKIGQALGKAGTGLIGPNGRPLRR